MVCIPLTDCTVWFGQDEVLFDDDDAPEAPKALGDIVESLVAAVFLDCQMDLDRTWQVFQPLLQDEIGELCCLFVCFGVHKSLPAWYFMKSGGFRALLLLCV